MATASQPDVDWEVVFRKRGTYLCVGKRNLREYTCVQGMKTTDFTGKDAVIEYLGAACLGAMNPSSHAFCAMIRIASVTLGALDAAPPPYCLCLPLMK